MGTVQPAYTSMIGRLSYQPQYGISVHHCAALVIGRRGGLKVWRERMPKPLREWMQRQGKWNDTPYRKADWSAWNNLKQEISAALLKGAKASLQRTNPVRCLNQVI